MKSTGHSTVRALPGRYNQETMTDQNETDNEDWKEKHKALEKEYDDFREQSQSLERELEMDLETLEKNNKELKSKNNQLQFDLDTLRVCTCQIRFYYS